MVILDREGTADPVRLRVDRSCNVYVHGQRRHQESDIIPAEKSCLARAGRQANLRVVYHSMGFMHAVEAA